MSRLRVLASAAGAGGVDAQTRPALVAPEALFERREVDQAGVEGLGQRELGLVQRTLVEPDRADPVGRRSVGPLRLIARTGTSSGRGRVQRVVVVLIGGRIVVVLA
jgi:hypothetical protein